MTGLGKGRESAHILSCMISHRPTISLHTQHVRMYTERTITK